MFEKAMDNKFEAQCFACLSIGRRMSQIGIYSKTFRILVPEYCFQTVVPLEAMELCWECYSLLRKATTFQVQVQKAKEILQSGQSIHGSLSGLSSVIKNDTEPHVIYFIEGDTNIKEENTEIVEGCDNLNSSWQDDDDNELVCPKTESRVLEFKSETKENIINKSTKSSKWVMKRAKPKFKILDVKDMKIDDFFRKDRNKIQKSTRCLICGFEFQNDVDIINHYKSVHEKDVFCDVCNTIFSNKLQYSSHKKIHAWKYECNICNYICHSEIHCQKHLMKTHRQVFECILCLMKFVSRRKFFDHYKTWHEKYICDYCGISFKMRYCIKDHIRKQHSPIECQQCNKRYARYNGLWLHNKLRHGPPAVTSYCVECDKSYPDIYRYKWHLANSIKHKPKQKESIPCLECDKIFTKKIYMKDHYNLVHLKKFNYRCEDCDKNYVRNADLMKHKRRVHEGILPPKNKICNLCGRGFTTNKILANHLRTHTGERPFACAVCPARFAQRTALVGHTKALHHSDERNKKS